jgi:branched-chain amino acid transport system permease protein
MADVMERVTTAEPGQPVELPARPVDLRRAVRIGLIAGVVAVFLSAIGMVENFDARDLIGTLSLGYTLLVGVGLLMGFTGATPPRRLEGYAAAPPGLRNLLAGAIVGIFGGAMLALFTWFVSTVEVRDIFPNISPTLIELLTFGRDLGPGLLLLIGWSLALGVIGGAVHLIPPRLRRSVIRAAAWVLGVALLESVLTTTLERAELGRLRDFLYDPIGALSYVGAAVVAVVVIAIDQLLLRRKTTMRARIATMPWPARKRIYILLAAVGLLALAGLPHLLGQFLTEVLNLVGIFMLMALGLNIVVGFAGLLDLGYVAFFAVGAYTTAVLMSPHSPTFSPELPFWVALVPVLFMGVIAGVFIGTPVLRMRGDYLAIVTLGFGEITRLLFLSDWLRPYFGGAQGIIGVPSITIGPFELNSPQAFFYMIFGLALIIAYASYALLNSRTGRSWIAMREDETVADAMGVNTVVAKLSAFAIGALFASFAGALFATKIHSVVPASFTVDESILVLIIVIVGGIASVPGVAVGALALVGLPEVLREFEEYRFLVYGALLIFMMLKRPAGLIPSRRRAAELQEDEQSQDAWLKEATHTADAADGEPA